MKKRRKHAKALVMQPLFRLRQETPQKGKGSYRRKARPDFDKDGLFGFWAWSSSGRKALRVAGIRRTHRRVP